MLVSTLIPIAHIIPSSNRWLIMSAVPLTPFTPMVPVIINATYNIVINVRPILKTVAGPNFIDSVMIWYLRSPSTSGISLNQAITRLKPNIKAVKIQTFSGIPDEAFRIELKCRKRNRFTITPRTVKMQAAAQK